MHFSAGNSQEKNESAYTDPNPVKVIKKTFDLLIPYTADKKP